MVTSRPATSNATGPAIVSMIILRNFSDRRATCVTYGEVMPNLFGLPGQTVAKVQQYLERGSAELHYVRKIFEAGAFRLEAPQNYAAMAADIYKWGEFGMLPSLNARRHPDRAACIDEDGEFSFAELDDAAHAVANGLLEMGVKGGDGVAIL